jgi:hypothetical protein
MEEVEDEGDIPPKLRTEIYMQPDAAWPYKHTNSLGARATPGRGVPNETSMKRESDANHQVPDMQGDEKMEETEMKLGKNEGVQAAGTAKLTHVDSEGVSATPVRGVKSQLYTEMSSTDHLDMETLDIDPEVRGPWKGDERETVGEAQADGTGLRGRAISVGAGVTPLRGVQTEQVLLAENTTDNANAAAEW